MSGSEIDHPPSWRHGALRRGACHRAALGADPRPRWGAKESSKNRDHGIVGYTISHAAYMLSQRWRCIRAYGWRGAVYTIIEPVAVVPVSDTENLRRALLDVISRKNIDVVPPKDKQPPPVLPKYAGVKTWAAFERRASTWNIEEKKNGNYRIIGHRKHADGYWIEDYEEEIEFPRGTKIDAVVDRMIAILQQAAAKGSQ